MRLVWVILILTISSNFCQSSKSLGFIDIKPKMQNFSFKDEIDGMQTEKENSKLMVVTIAGETPFAGDLTCIPTMLNIQYKNEEGLFEISPSRAVGLSGKDQDGNFVENWLTVEDNFMDVMYLSYDKKEKVKINFAFDLPDYVKDFEILYPVKLK